MASAQMAGLLEVTPGELQFQVVVGDYSKRQMRLHNTGTKPIAYKIKTTNPKQYFVRPNQGVVKAGERKPIAVMMGKLTAEPTDKCKDKFLVQSIAYEGPIPEDGADEKFDWRRDVNEKMPGAKADECRLRCVYQVSEKGAAASPKPAETQKTTVTNEGASQRKPAPAPAFASPVATPSPAANNTKVAAKHSYSMYLVIAIMFFIVGRFTHHIAIPGLD
eukprot:TRINITY_DN37_c0_g1_i1.p1 TRINITY_DN37_c0_g1~~TRINITY_DN37_c0_g1_i1.p1  ORF type:complete len:219 (-),score=59.53 TRINITY_DN37_c0_g1_i1:373-1029(-)